MPRGHPAVKNKQNTKLCRLPLATYEVRTLPQSPITMVIEDARTILAPF